MTKENQSKQPEKENGDAKTAPPREGITPENVENFNRGLDKIFGKRKDEEE